MKNTFKCKNIPKDASCSSHSRPRTNDVITLASTNDEKDSTLHPTVENPNKEHRGALCAENIKIAPIFLPRTASKRNTNVWIGQQEVDFPCRIQREQQVKILQDAKLCCDTTHRKSRHRERLPPPDVTRCLEEIQTSNPVFAARTAFSYLQEKSRALYSGNTFKTNKQPLCWCYILCICSVQHSQQTIQTLSVLQNHSEHGSPERVLKRPRLCLTAGCTAVVVDQPASAQGDVERTSRNLLQPRSSHLSRTRRLKQLNASGLIKNSEGQSDKTMTDPQKGKWGPMTLFFSTTFWHFFPPMILKGLFVLLI